MAILTLQSRGLLFILLLAGNEVATMSAMRTAMRTAIDIAQMVKEPAKEEASVPVPTSSSGCLMSGVRGKGKCEPAPYCYFGLRWSSLGGFNRDKSCHLKWFYKPDEELAYRFGIASAKVIVKGEQFRTSGSISQLGKLKDYYQVFGKCANAATSTVPTHKTHLNWLKTAFQGEQIHQYATSVNALARKIPRLKEFKIDGLEEDALKANAVERMEENLDLGMKQNVVLSTFATKVNIVELMKVKAMADADHATLAVQMAKVAPSMSPEQLDKVVSEAVANKNAQLRECNSDDECMKGKTETLMDAMSEHLSEVEETSVTALLQYAESKGLSQAKHDEDHHDRRNRAFSFLEEHMESVEGLTEHGKELHRNTWVLLVILIVFIVLAIT